MKRVKLQKIISKIRWKRHVKYNKLVPNNALIDLNTHGLSSCSTSTIQIVEMEEKRKERDYQRDVEFWGMD